ncbi:MAG: redoxin domain-containing protein [Promethearchaeota archaeon]|nr:MAG: redoxin domain-containing protein [Candidatus Lokiarchaeota archaeon]
MSDNELERIKMKKAELLLKESKMPKEIIKIHSMEEFDKLAKDYPDKIVVVDFWAVWCGPCMTFAPLFERLHAEYSKGFIFVKVNVDEIGSIAQRYRITGIPTTLFLKAGSIVHKIVGAYPYDHMKRIFNDLQSAE